MASARALLRLAAAVLGVAAAVAGGRTPVAAAAAAAPDPPSNGAVDFSPLLPDVIREAPLSVLSYSFGGVSFAPGEELKPAQVRSAPSLSWTADPGDFFTVAMVDPDATASPNETYREFLHWLVINVQGGALDGEEGGEPLAEYMRIGPPLDSGVHRYALLVFRQPGPLPMADEPRRNATSVAKRSFFSIQRFAEVHNLELPAAAGNFFRAQWDESVPALYRLLMGQQPLPSEQPPA